MTARLLAVAFALASATLPLVLLEARPAPPVDPAPVAADTLVDVGGWRLHLNVRPGTIPVTIVLEAGGGTGITGWEWVPESLDLRTDATVVAYDRSGFGRSDLGPPDLAPRDEIAALRRALDAVGAAPRTLLVGHSYGALISLLHASLHPDRVVGLVLVDPMNPRFVEATGDFVFGTATAPPDPSTDRERALARLIRGFPGLVEDVAAVEAGLPQPMTILTAGEGWWDARHGVEGIDAAWRASHRAMAAAPDRRLVVVEGSRHDVPEARPDAIVDAVMEMLE